MRKYDLVLSYRDLDVENIDLLESILEHLDAPDIWTVDGQTRVRAAQEASSAIEAVEIVVEAIRRGAPAARAEAVELVLMSVSEIAAQVGLNREAVRLWTVGKRGPGGFPDPIDIIGDRIKVWAAADVWNWLHGHDLPCPEARPLSVAEVTDGNRAIDRLRRRWANQPTLMDSAHWRGARHDEATVQVHAPRKSTAL